MKEHWKTILGFSIGIIIFASVLTPLAIYYRIEVNDPHNIGYIHIDEDKDFKRAYFPGSGTEADPYLIENYHFSDEYYAILINGTTKCFIIQNCIISFSDFAIYLFNINNCSVIIQNNICFDCDYAILLQYSSSVTIRNNTCKDSGRGLVLGLCNNILLSENACFNISTGILCQSSSYIEMEKNTVSYCRFGILLYGLDNCIFRNNTSSHVDYDGISISKTENSLFENNILSYNLRSGISLHWSTNNSLCGNQLFSCGLDPYATHFDSYSQNIYTNNSVNNKPLGYFVNLTNEVFSETKYGQLFFVNCTNIVVKNQNTSSASRGLTFYRCKNTTVLNNICNYNTYSGIFASDSQQMILYNNTCNFNKCEEADLWGDGIDIRGVSELFLINNTCLGNTYGIDLNYSNDAVVTNNTCMDSYYGLYLSECFNCSIITNKFNENLRGINSWISDFCVITYNLFSDNTRDALSIYYGTNNTIHHNNFIDNNVAFSSSQAFDSGSYNLWFDNSTKEGNYWSNWSGSGNYSIDGYSNAYDLFPLSSPVIYNLKIILNYHFLDFFPLV